MIRIYDWETKHGILTLHVDTFIVSLITLRIPYNCWIFTFHYRAHDSKVFPRSELIVVDLSQLWIVVLLLLDIMVIKNLRERYDLIVTDVYQALLNEAELHS
jgi:hypothetical protein